jgi:hypothetical protein
MLILTVQMAALNKMNRDNYLYGTSSYQLEQQQTLPNLSIQERYICAATGFTNPKRYCQQ